MECARQTALDLLAVLLIGTLGELDLQLQANSLLSIRAAHA